MTTEQRHRGELFIASRMDTPFEWGVHDCGLFVADFIFETTGVDYAADIRYKYSDQAGAVKAFQEISCAGVTGYLRRKASIHQWESVTPETARWGDVGILRNGRDSACICIGAEVIAAGQDRLITKPRSMASHLWRAI
jgi:hypothetical protein